MASLFGKLNKIKNTKLKSSFNLLKDRVIVIDGEFMDVPLTKSDIVSAHNDYIVANVKRAEKPGPKEGYFLREVYDPAKNRSEWVYVAISDYDI